jgi:excisionase family DNA binding protein
MVRSRREIISEGDAPFRRLLSLATAARYVALSYWTLRTLLHRGEIPFIRAGRRLLVDRLDLDHWIEANKTREE